MTNLEDGNVLIEGARVIFRNFGGAEQQFNAKGERNFCVVLNEQLAADMVEDGWNVKTLASREEDEPGQPIIEVKVSFKKRPPRIVMITSKGRTELDEETCELLDQADVKNWDLIFHPYKWGPINGKSGVKAYLKTIYVTINEDYLELKYADLEEMLPTSSGQVYE